MFSSTPSDARRRTEHDWAAKNDVELRFIQPGKPMQNAYIESFNSLFRDDCLSRHWFASLSQMRSVLDNWRDDYNHHRGHSSLGYVPPAEFAARCRATRSINDDSTPDSLAVLP